MLAARAALWSLISRDETCGNSQFALFCSTSAKSKSFSCLVLGFRLANGTLFVRRQLVVPCLPSPSRTHPMLAFCKRCCLRVTRVDFSATTTLCFIRPHENHVKRRHDVGDHDASDGGLHNCQTPVPLFPGAGKPTDWFLRDTGIESKEEAKFCYLSHSAPPVMRYLVASSHA